MNDLLPPNATQLERDLADTTARISDVDVSPVSGLWNADTCPVALLPWLAWAEQVPEWSSQWPEDVQRSAIKVARIVRRKRGTAGAVKDALESLGMGVQLTEWFDYAGTPGTFTLDAELSDRGLTQEEQSSIERVVAQTKNARSHLDVINIIIAQRGAMNYAAAHQSGDETTLYPLIITEIEQSLPMLHAVASQDFDTTTINPLQ